MRVTTGLFKGRKLISPSRRKIRLSTDKVRKAIFDILADFVKGTTVLELFAGSGALGIEALSRGAKEVVFVDNEKACCETIKKNIPNEFKKHTQVIFSTASETIEFLKKKNKKFDLVLMDPPYRKGLALLCLQKICECSILRPNAVVVVEHHRKEFLPPRLKQLNLIKQNSYGETQVSLFSLEEK